MVLFEECVSTTQWKIYGGAFSANIVLRELQSSVVDVWLSPKCASTVRKVCRCRLESKLFLNFIEMELIWAYFDFITIILEKYLESPWFYRKISMKCIFPSFGSSSRRAHKNTCSCWLAMQSIWISKCNLEIVVKFLFYKLIWPFFTCKNFNIYLLLAFFQVL